MFDMNSLKKLADEIPADVKEKLERAAMEKLGLSGFESSKGSEAEASSSNDAVAQCQTDSESDAPSGDSESTDEINTDPA